MRRRALGLAQDFIVGERDRFANALSRSADLPLEPLRDDIDGDRGGHLTGGVPAYPVDHEKHAALSVDEVPILVAGADAAAVARRCGVDATHALGYCGVTHDRE